MTSCVDYYSMYSVFVTYIDCKKTKKIPIILGAINISIKQAFVHDQQNNIEQKLQIVNRQLHIASAHRKGVRKPGTCIFCIWFIKWYLNEGDNSHTLYFFFRYRILRVFLYHLLIVLVVQNILIEKWNNQKHRNW